MIRLTVDGRVYEGWISVEVERSMDEFANRFSLGYLDRWTTEQEPWPIRKGAKCVVSWRNTVLVTGYVNRTNMQADEKTWQLSAEGRSLGDLVDCSATHTTGHWKNRTATQIATDLCKPFGITVTSDLPDLEPFPRFTLQEGETVHDAIERLCKVRALLPMSTPDGNVRLFNGDAPGPVYTLNPAAAKSRGYGEDDSDRFSTYLMRATGVGSALEAFTKAQVADIGVERFRPLVVVSDAPANTKQAKLRAQWEANVRAGRGETLSYVFQAVEDGTGKPYRAGDKYRIKDDLFGVDEVMLVRRATVRSGEEDLETRVDFVRPETYAQLAYPSKKLVKKTTRKKTKRGGLGL